MDKLDAVVFDAPSGGIQAILTAQLSRGGKLKRVGHAYIFGVSGFSGGRTVLTA